MEEICRLIAQKMLPRSARRRLVGVELWGHNRPRFDDNWNSRGGSSAPGHFLHYDEDGPHFRGSGEWMSGPSQIRVGHCVNIC